MPAPEQSRRPLRPPAGPRLRPVAGAADRRRAVDAVAADLGIPGCRAAHRRRRHHLSRRLRPGGGGYRGDADRAGGERHRGHALHVLPVHRRWADEPDGHLPPRHRPRPGADPGAGRRRRGAAPPARGGAALGRHHPQAGHRPADGDLRQLAGWQLRPALCLQLRAAPGTGRAAADRRYRRHRHAGRARLRHAGLARPRAHGGERHHRRGRRRRHPGAECRGRRRPDRRAAGGRPGLPAQPDLPRPAGRCGGVRDHRHPRRRGWAAAAAARYRPGGIGRGVLHHQQHAAGPPGGGAGRHPAARLERAGDGRGDPRPAGRHRPQTSPPASPPRSPTTRPASSPRACTSWR